MAENLTPERELELVRAQNKANGRLQNPFISKGYGGWQIGFRVRNNDSEPLWWTDHGFKNLARVNAPAADFATAEECAAKVRVELLEFIRQWRSNQVHLIYGWDV